MTATTTTFKRVARLAVAVVASLAMIATPAVVGAEGETEPDPIVRPIVFPVKGGAYYWNDWGQPRSGGRTHQGNDLFAAKHTPLVATTDGIVRYISRDGSLSGNMLILEDRQGWRYYYIHINNDTPGTDDGANVDRHAFKPQVEVGTYVLAGQPIAYLGDSGNAEETSPHVHFEIRDPYGNHVNPYHSLQRAAHRDKPRAADAELHTNGGHYVLDTSGRVHRFGRAPLLGSADLEGTGHVAVDFDLMPSGDGYVILDSSGVVHRFGSAVEALDGLETKTWDDPRAVEIELMPDGAGFVVLNSGGRLFRAGSASSVPAARGSAAYGTDHAVDMELIDGGQGVVVISKDGATFGGGTATDLLASLESPTSNRAITDLLTTPSSTDGGLAILNRSGRLKGTGVLDGITSPLVRHRSRFIGAAGDDGHLLVVRIDGLHRREHDSSAASL